MNSNMISGNRLRQRGQVLVMGLAMLIMSAAGLFLMFDSSQVISTKARLVNAADASAYSAAAWRARVFNYIAYSNRAIIAQEIAVAQAVTLDSYAHYFATFAESVDTLANLWPPAKVVTQAVATAADYAKDITSNAATAEIVLRDAPYVGYKTLLQHSQRVMRTAANGFGSSAVALEIAKATDRRFTAFALPDSKYSKFTKRYESDEDRKRLRRVVLDSLDPFTSGERNQTTFISGGCLPIEYKKRGGTILTPELERWEAGDTGSIHAGFSGFFSGCSSSEWYPMGWGASEASGSHNAQRLLGNPGSVKSNPKSFDNANSEFGGSHTGTGIAKVYGMSDIRGAGSYFPTSRVAVLASVLGNRITTSASAGVAAGALAKSARWTGGRLWALSAAEVYFARPPDAPVRVEYANLYNPFWQARLVAVLASETQQANARAK